jgi:N-methylhydantoinase B/oxoprolinase/acetone carboxylase alpha subunit
VLAAKVDNVAWLRGRPCDFRTAGGGGSGDPHERDLARTHNDVARKLMNEANGGKEYGVLSRNRCQSSGMTRFAGLVRRVWQRAPPFGRSVTAPILMSH